MGRETSITNDAHILHAHHSFLRSTSPLLSYDGPHPAPATQQRQQPLKHLRLGRLNGDELSGPLMELAALVRDGACVRPIYSGVAWWNGPSMDARISGGGRPRCIRWIDHTIRSLHGTQGTCPGWRRCTSTTSPPPTAPAKVTTRMAAATLLLAFRIESKHAHTHTHFPSFPSLHTHTGRVEPLRVMIEEGLKRRRSLPRLRDLSLRNTGAVWEGGGRLVYIYTHIMRIGMDIHSPTNRPLTTPTNQPAEQLKQTNNNAGVTSADVEDLILHAPPTLASLSLGNESEILIYNFNCVGWPAMRTLRCGALCCVQSSVEWLDSTSLLTLPPPHYARQQGCRRGCR